MSLPEYIKDEFTDNVDEKCNFCQGKYTTKTKCCDVKLCQFHIRRGLEDELYLECEDCIECDIVDDKCRYQEHKEVYCKEHNKDNLIYDDVTQSYYCTNHISKEHTWKEIL